MIETPNANETADAGSSIVDSAGFDALLSAAVDAIITIDPSGRILKFNTAAERMFGYAAAEIIGSPVSSLMPEPDRSAHQSYLEHYLGTGERRIIGIGREVEGLKRTGEVFPISLSVGEALSESSHFFVGIIRDLSKERAAERERRTLEERLAHVGRFSLMGEMAAGIAHEINQPLGAIATYAQAANRLIKMREPDMGALSEACAGVSKQARRASQVIENLRNFIRQRDVEHAAVDLQKTFADVMPLIEADARAAGVPLSVEFDQNIPEVPGDPVQLQQVLVNLIRNAVDAMRESPRRERGIAVRTSREAEKVVVTVTDSGPGVSAKVSSALFEPFVSTKKDGLGVGLAISRRIARAHDGELKCEANPTGGSIFSLRLPIAGTRQ